jgi:hypothetical protein
MRATDIIRLPDPRTTVRATVDEVVRDVKGAPHIWIRVKLTGWYFPALAALPFLLVGDIVSSFVVVAADRRSACAYFAKSLPSAQKVSFGYGRIVKWDFDVEIHPPPVRLDRARLARHVIDPFRLPD